LEKSYRSDHTSVGSLLGRHSFPVCLNLDLTDPIRFDEASGQVSQHPPGLSLGSTAPAIPEKMIASSWKWSIAIGIVSAALTILTPDRKKIEILAVKIDQPKTRSIYLLDLAFGVLGDDRLFHGVQFGIECRDDAGASQLGGKGRLTPKKTNKNQDRQKRPACGACLHRPVRQFRIRWRAFPDDRRARPAAAGRAPT